MTTGAYLGTIPGDQSEGGMDQGVFAGVTISVVPASDILAGWELWSCVPK